MGVNRLPDTENLELINLRNRVRCQRQEINRLLEENEALKKPQKRTRKKTAAPKTEEERLADRAFETQRRKFIREERRNYYLCADCGKQDAYTLAGRYLCFECYEKQKARRKRCESKIDYKALYLERKSNNLCTSCGKPTDGKHRLCDHCRIWTSRYEKLKRGEHRGEKSNWPRGDNGFCWLCNKQPHMEDKKLCPECYAKSLKNIEAALLAAQKKRQE